MSTLQEIERTYDTVAEEYAAAFLGEHFKKPKDQEVLHHFSQIIDGRKPIWELGCGPGHTTKYLNDLGIEISGLDLSTRMIEQASERYPELHFKKGNIFELDFDDSSVAGCIAFYSIVHFSNEQVLAAFREVFRVLRPGGLFLCTFHIGDETIQVEEFLGRAVNIDFMFFTSEFILTSLTTAGFQRLQLIERDPYPEVEYQSRRGYVFAEKP